MGWASGSGLMESFIRKYKCAERDEVRRHKVYSILIPIFRDDGDCDTLCEVRGLDAAFDSAAGFKDSDD